MIILFAYFAATNLYYSLFNKFLESLSLFSIYNKFKNLTIDTNYRQYNIFIAEFYFIWDFNLYKKDIIDADKKDYRRTEDKNNNNKKDNKKIDKNYIKKKRKPAFLDILKRFSSLNISKRFSVLDILRKKLF